MGRCASRSLDLCCARYPQDSPAQFDGDGDLDAFIGATYYNELHRCDSAYSFTMITSTPFSDLHGSDTAKLITLAE